MKKFAWILPVSAGILWGSIGVFIRTLDNYGMDSFTVVESRVSMALLLLLAGIGIYDRKQLKVRLKDLWILALAGIAGMFGLNVTYNEAINHLPLSLAAVLLSLSPVFVLILASVFFKEKITARKAGCAVLAILGCTLASGLLESLTGLELSPVGIVMGVASGIFYALYSIFTKSAMKRGYSGLTITFYCMLAVGIILAPLSDWGQIFSFYREAPAANTGFMILHALCGSVLPYVLYTVAIQFMDAGKVSILAAGEPVAAMVFGMIFFREIPTPLEFLGLAVTVAAIVLLGMPERRKNRKASVGKPVRLNKG